MAEMSPVLRGYDTRYPSERERKRQDAMRDNPPIPCSDKLASYVTREGKRVLAVRIGNRLVGLTNTGTTESWLLNGHRLCTRETPEDIVRLVPCIYPRTEPGDFMSSVQAYAYADRVAQHKEGDTIMSEFANAEAGNVEPKTPVEAGTAGSSFDEAVAGRPDWLISTAIIRSAIDRIKGPVLAACVLTAMQLAIGLLSLFILVTS